MLMNELPSPLVSQARQKFLDLPRRRRWGVAVFVLLIGAVSVIGYSRRLDSIPNSALRNIARGEFSLARSELEWCLRFHPKDAQARLLLAQAFALDNSLPSAEAVERAISQLQLIPDEATNAAEARTREGRLRLLILNQPMRAERLFRCAIELDPTHDDAWYLLWRLLNLTWRFHLTEPLFWQVYERSPDSTRAERLREWYLAEFGRGSLNAIFDRNMGFLGGIETPTDLTDLKRLNEFKLAEPDAPATYAAVARVLFHQGERDWAFRTLQEGERLETAFQDQYFVSTLVDQFLSRGWYNEAAACMARWPEPRDGYEYWRLLGIVADEVENNDSLAIEAYDRALQCFPGQNDWEVMFRKAHCLVRKGDLQGAEKSRRMAEHVQKAFSKELHEGLRKALVRLDDARSLMPIVEFYDSIGRKRESSAWRRHIGLLNRASR